MLRDRERKVFASSLLAKVHLMMEQQMVPGCHSELVTCIHVECQRLADVSRGKQAGPGGRRL